MAVAPGGRELETKPEVGVTFKSSPLVTYFHPGPHLKASTNFRSNEEPSVQTNESMGDTSDSKP